MAVTGASETTTDCIIVIDITDDGDLMLYLEDE